MLDIGWQELLVIAVIAVIVVGPRELPQLMRTAGQWMGKARRMARDFQFNLEEMGREAELDGLRKDIERFKQPMDPFRIDGKSADPVAGAPEEEDIPPEPKL